MGVDAIKFPVICFWQDLIRIRFDKASLITTTKAGIKNGMFTDLFIVDSDYSGFVVKSAKKLHGVGFLWGFNIFLNQNIRVELTFEGKPRKVALDEIKGRIFQSFQKWHGWATRGDFDELQEKVRNAQSISEIIQLLS